MSIEEYTTQIRLEHDACGIYAQLEKLGDPSRKPIEAGLQAIAAMHHRAGFIGEEGDGCGLQIDLPRELWKSWLREAGVQEDIVENEQFYIGHLLLQRSSYSRLITTIEKILADQGLSILLKRSNGTNADALGPNAYRDNPVFLQLSGLSPDNPELALFKAQTALEKLPGVHVASLSRYTVVYKTVGDSQTLSNYYKDLQDERCLTSFVLAHARYSTNTSTSFARVQPFGILGHNGEINTITRFYSEASMLNIPMCPDFSDSQIIDQGIHSFVAAHGWSLFETAELLFPPILNEMNRMPKRLMDMYSLYRQFWGPFSQGPAALIMRYADEAVFSVDALGLRPLWLVDTEESYCFTSEQGIIPSEYWISDPKPLAPGEKMGAKKVKEGSDDTQLWKLYSYGELQSKVFEAASNRYQFQGTAVEHQFNSKEIPFQTIKCEVNAKEKPLSIRGAAFGFRSYDYKLMEMQISTGTEPIQSLGYDQAIAALSPEMSLLSDYLQETVAVVTNPAIDREREIEHFSTRVILGCRPSFTGQYIDSPRFEVLTPLLLDEVQMVPSLTPKVLKRIAEQKGTMLYGQVVEQMHGHSSRTQHRILLHRKTDETSLEAIKRFQEEALQAAQEGANIIILDDCSQFIKGAHTDPYVSLAAVHHVLSHAFANGESLRRRLSLILCSGGIRNLHDIAVALGVGADAIVPYLMWEFAAVHGGAKALENLLSSLTKGLEKVISTMGIHEIRGYERLFGAIGLSSELANMMGVPAFCKNEYAGYSFSKMDEQSVKREAVYLLEDDKKLRPRRTISYFPAICKSAASFAKGKISYGQYLKALEHMENKNPISLRHVLQFKEANSSTLIDWKDVDSTIDEHAYPFVISSMSFGSQGETSFRAYAEAAYRLNIVSLNGEGGEIKDLLRKFPLNRGREIASGRFGVNADLCNHAYVLEIKIGQGAKPGEGGHLPGSKVTDKVAAARNSIPGVDLISPSNNHDIYSIEDLAQVIFELKEVNPKAKVAVKVPVVPNIGTISVGIVKAGADIVELSGFDGGTGAARSHAIRHVGLPMEIGIKLVHDALCEAGLRDSAEIWADGGMKSGTDVMKSILLGANRVGFATMAIAAIGCTDCRMCMERKVCSLFNETCKEGETACSSSKSVHCLHDLPGSVASLHKFFTEIGQHVKELTAQLGAKRTQELVGRRDLLEQISAHDSIDLQWMLEVKEANKGKGTKVKFRSHIRKIATTKEAWNEVPANGTDIISFVEKDDAEFSVGPFCQTVPRALGVYESGRTVRDSGVDGYQDKIRIEHSGVAGAGFAAYHSEGMTSIAHGGSQDGTGKTALGGKVVILKTPNKKGMMVGGSVGKGLAYGAQGGLFIIQGNADARAGIRLSGADLVIGGELQAIPQNEMSFLGTTANIKGFAFEYMTAGRAIVLGDPGPWICSGMTGGRVYLRLLPEAGLTKNALYSRFAKGARIELLPLDVKGIEDVRQLLTAYHQELINSGQIQIAKALETMIKDPLNHFLMVEPQAVITDQENATE